MSEATIERRQVAGMNIHWGRYSLDAFLDAQRDLGFETIELWCAPPHVWLDHLTLPDARDLKRRIEGRGLRVCTLTPENCSSPYQFAAKEPEHRERSYRYFSNGIRLAAELGCEHLEANSGWGYWDEDREEAWARSREMLSRLADDAQREGIDIVMESLRPQESQLVITVGDAKRMFDEIDHPAFKVMVDTCAMGVAGETLDEWFEVFGDDIRHTHFIDGTPYGHLVWGDGMHHLGEFIDALDRWGYDGYLGQEITDARYFDDPCAADERNLRNFERYID